jgi:hypothetical protein
VANDRLGLNGAKIAPTAPKVVERQSSCPVFRQPWFPVSTSKRCLSFLPVLHYLALFVALLVSVHFMSLIRQVLPKGSDTRRPLFGLHQTWSGYNSFWIEWGQFHGDGCAFKSIAVSMYKNDVFSYRRHNLLFSNSCLQSSLQSYDDGTTLVLSVPISHSPPFIMYYCCSFTPNKMPVDQQLPEGEVVSRLSLACQSQKNTYPAPPARRIHRPTPTIMVSCYNFAVSFAISFHFLTPI